MIFSQNRIVPVLILLFVIEVAVSISCSVPISMVPSAALLLVAPVAIVGLAFKSKDSEIPSFTGMLAVVPFLIIAYRVDCVGPFSGDAAMGGIFPWLYGIPVGLFSGWVASRFVKEKPDEDH